MSNYAVTIDGRCYELEFDLPLERGQKFTVRVGDETLCVRIPPTEGIDWIIINDRPYELYFDGSPHILQSSTDIHRVEVRDRDTAMLRPSSADGRIKAPIPGVIARILVEPGAQVQLGQPILILEAMKMGNEIRAPRAGQVGAIQVEVGRVVKRGEPLAEII